MNYTLEHHQGSWTIMLGLKPVAIFYSYYEALKRVNQLNHKP